MAVWNPRANAVFLEALETPAEQRPRFLDGACGADSELRAQVERLLDADRRAGGFLDQPAALCDPVTELRTEGDPAALDANALSFLAPTTKVGSLGRLGHYEILQLVGRGGMGVVLKAFDEQLHRVVAVKVLSPALANSAPSRQRFLREARAAAAVSHDHVVTIHAVEPGEGVPYLVMQFVAGKSLQQKLDRQGTLPVTEVLRIGHQIARGLSAAHEQGLIHRDIKPANILLENGIERVRITDFGLARAVDDVGLTQSGVIAGTPTYMSPEQADGLAVDQRSDLFSLGTVMYAMCVGRSPFHAPSTVAVLKRVCTHTPRPIRETNPDVPEELCAVIERLLAKSPAERFSTAAEVAEALGGLLSRLQQPASPDPVARDDTARIPTPPRRGRRWLTAAAVLLLLSLTGLGLLEATGTTRLRGTVVRLMRPEGTLVVETDDPGVSVTIDGQDVVITGAGPREVRLKAGLYSLTAKKDGEVVRQDLVEITKDGRKVVRVALEPKAAAVAPEEDGWLKATKALPAEKQVEAVFARLKSLNKDFDPVKIRYQIADGAVIDFQAYDAGLSDIAPLRAFTRLQKVSLTGNPITDPSPLRDLPITELGLYATKVSDLNVLKGKKLELLDISHTGVKDLALLAGMPLSRLELAHTAVADLSPLKGMKLKHLSCADSRVTDLSPLAGMPLTELVVAGLEVRDLSPLAGMPLTVLYLDRTGVTDLKPLAGMALQMLTFDAAKIADRSVLLKMPLETVYGSFDPEADEKFLRSFATLKAIDGKPAAEFLK